MFNGRNCFALFVCAAMALSCLATQDDVDQFMAAVHIPGGVRSTNVYSLTLPVRLQVPDEMLNVSTNDCSRDEVVFDLYTTGKVLVANCILGKSISSVQAERELCGSLVDCVQTPLADYARFFSASRNEAGDLFIHERSGASSPVDDVTRFHRTAGNLYLSIKAYTNTVSVTAHAIADAVLSFELP